jgi:quercetin dioxygenase-like cupin family protein
MRISVVSFLAIALFFNGNPAGAVKEKPAHDDEHVVVRPANLKWVPAPAALPAGAQIAVLVGDPSKKGMPYAFRVKLPDGYKVPPHTHPVDENVTVFHGTLLIGRGKQFDGAKTEELPSGSYMRMPKGMPHFAVAKGETILQVHGVGPFEIQYVNPADDPRKK